MAKKKSVKKSSKKKSRKKSSPKATKTLEDLRVERVLVENFIALQKVMTNLSIKFDGLSDQIRKLLELFEISAKSLAEKDFKVERGSADSEKVVKKMDSLLEQNKIIARGMTLINDRILEDKPGAQRIPRPLPPANPRMQQPPQTNQIDPNQPTQDMNNTNMQGYQKSISSQTSNRPKRPQA